MDLVECLSVKHIPGMPPSRSILDPNVVRSGGCTNASSYQLVDVSCAVLAVAEVVVGLTSDTAVAVVASDTMLSPATEAGLEPWDAEALDFFAFVAFADFGCNVTLPEGRRL